MRFLSGICGAALAAALTISSAPQINAAPAFVSGFAGNQTDIVQVRDGVKWRRNHYRGRNHWRGDNDWRGGNYGWHNGYRGYRHRRHGYRYYNGFWFPGGAFVAGALLGGIIANDGYGGGYGPRYYLDGNGGGSHVEWCYNRYRSYRAYDNTFQPYHGPRRQCNSPYY